MNPAPAPPCVSCPKLCSDVCPTHEVSAREVFAPWAKVTLAALATSPGERPGPGAAQAFAACTGCLRCTLHCPHGFEVPQLLEAARTAAVRAGSAPAASAQLPIRFAATGHGEAGDLRAVHRTLQAAAARTAAAAGPAQKRISRPGLLPRIATGAPPPAPVAPLLFAGCDALAAGGGTAAQALAVAAALGAPLRLAPDGALCCGLKLAEAGHPELFAAHAARTRTALLEQPGVRGSGDAKRAGPVHLVFLAPGCARALTERWPAAGAALPAGSVVEHVTSFLARALARRPDLSSRPRLPGAVTFHDPCQLARGLVEVTAPRALLAAAVSEVREPARGAAETSCCGFGGLLPRTNPELSRELARTRSAELRACGAPAVTASPGCAGQLGAEDVVAVLARWLAT